MRDSRSQPFLSTSGDGAVRRVVRSMDIATPPGYGQLREIMTEVMEQSAAVAQHYGGPWNTTRQRDVIFQR